jgi:hypothetical protein
VIITGVTSLSTSLLLGPAASAQHDVRKIAGLSRGPGVEVAWRNSWIRSGTTALFPIRQITSRIEAARRATGDDGERQNVIRTVHGRGYRFVADVVQLVPRAEPAEAATPGFVGRDAELSALWTSLAAAESGGRQLMLISGEPGIGKTALVEAFLAGLDGRVELLGVGQCHPVSAGEPYAPVLEAIFDLAQGPAAAPALRCLDAMAPGWLLQLPALIDVDHGSSLVNRTLGRRANGCFERRLTCSTRWPRWVMARSFSLSAISIGPIGQPLT